VATIDTNAAEPGFVDVNGASLTVWTIGRCSTDHFDHVLFYTVINNLIFYLWTDIDTSINPSEMRMAHRDPKSTDRGIRGRTRGTVCFEAIPVYL
jgi:hypothetical protein